MNASDSWRTPEASDINAYAKVLELATSPFWIYDFRSGCNLWGNSAALQFFGADVKTFKACQFDVAGSSSPELLSAWKHANEKVHQEVEVAQREIGLAVSRDRPAPGFLPKCMQDNGVSRLLYKPLKVLMDGQELFTTLIQVVQQQSSAAPDDFEGRLRMVEMCNNHPMFQFLFDADGKLLIGNQQAMLNLKEHLGTSENYTLQQYLASGESNQGLGPNEMYEQAMHAIFQEDKPCHRFPQLRASRRHPGKYRWVLYEMWPLLDPVTHEKAVLVCEQNITQVKKLEEQFRKQNERLEAQLEEALAQRDPVHKPAIDIDTPADKTLKMLEKIMRGQEVSAREALELRDAIVQAGDLRQPVNFNEQVMQQSHTILDLEVGESLIQLLSSRKTARAADGDDDSMRQTLDIPLMDRRGRGDSARVDSVDRLHAERATTEPSVAASGLITLQKNMPDALATVLANVENWQFDAFKLNEVSNGRPLSMLSYFLFKRSEMVSKFQLHEHKLVKFLMRVEEGYPDNPYHNRIHASDVLQSLHVLLCRGNLINSVLVDDTALMACYLSAIVHDYEHRGVNNDFLIRMSDSLAILYNDRSPMENHHLAASFQLIHSTDYNFMPSVPHKVKDELRKLMIEMVLATDMKQHFAIHSMFQSKFNASGARKSSGSSPLNSDAHTKLFDDDMKGLAIQLALKCADLGHLASPRTVHKKWVMQLEEEFFRQGDREKANNLGVSPLMDRDKNGITKSQVGFFDIVALPLFQSFAQAFPDAVPMLEAVKDNYTMWREDPSLLSSNST